MSWRPAGLSRTTRVAVALGSNLGDREAHLAVATARLATALSDFRVSSTYQTDPVGVSEPQPPFLNAAATGETSSTARQFFATLMAIERERGRTRSSPNAARTLDLDLVLFGSEIIAEPCLTVPHPRFRERLFVLEPLAEIDPDLRDPVTRTTVGELLERLRQERSARTP